MTTKQQREALEYFRKHAGDWRSKADDAGRVRVNVIGQRNGFVLLIADGRETTRAFLDVGCGTGELVCQMAKRGIDSTGVDYAAEMIELASKKAQEEALTRAGFVCASIFDFEMQPQRYDLVSANGFIEYISQQEMGTFFDLVADALTPGGSFVLGSRNRLFNLISMNDFTLLEEGTAGLDLLLREAVQWTNARQMPDVTSADCAPLQDPQTEHTRTGVEVTTRFQYSPFQLINILKERGLRAVEVYPVHIHGVSPAFKQAQPEIHTAISNLLQTCARHNYPLLVHASSFMLHAVKG